MGCCGAMMAVLVALGAMNIVWMAVFSLVMAVEKIVATDRIATLVGIGLLLAGFALSLNALGVSAIVGYLAG